MLRYGVQRDEKTYQQAELQKLQPIFFGGKIRQQQKKENIQMQQLERAIAPLKVREKTVVKVHAGNRGKQKGGDEDTRRYKQRLTENLFQRLGNITRRTQKIEHEKQQGQLDDYTEIQHLSRNKGEKHRRRNQRRGYQRRIDEKLGDVITRESEDASETHVSIPYA
ncbi:MAG: hypothetical protein A3J67_05250 [Parcubacteria group bacterium RIFCSPHIGHO2_02_FULL_48_10b]|nr:MAG: hypothetical protein A3J67_05250 [Parcubacteria group bacterium RIFCSPHIGHO2_02_FULL_48_10b]